MSLIQENPERDRYGLINPFLALGDVYKFTDRNPPKDIQIIRGNIRPDHLSAKSVRILF